MSSKWTKEEVDILRKYYVASSSDELVKMLPNRGYRAIMRKASTLGINKRDMTGGVIKAKQRMRQNMFVIMGKEIR